MNQNIKSELRIGFLISISFLDATHRPPQPPLGSGGARKASIADIKGIDITQTFSKGEIV
ncbi:MAG: hypothetical protein Fur006_27220 [Coleofasciculaceae cyanobacterium]